MEDEPHTQWDKQRRLRDVTRPITINWSKILSSISMTEDNMLSLADFSLNLSSVHKTGWQSTEHTDTTSLLQLCHCFCLEILQLNVEVAVAYFNQIDAGNTKQTAVFLPPLAVDTTAAPPSLCPLSQEVSTDSPAP